MPAASETPRRREVSLLLAILAQPCPDVSVWAWMFSFGRWSAQLAGPPRTAPTPRLAPCKPAKLCRPSCCPPAVDAEDDGDDSTDEGGGGGGGGGGGRGGRGRASKKGKSAADAASVKACREKARREKLNEWWVRRCCLPACWLPCVRCCAIPAARCRAASSLGAGLRAAQAEGPLKGCGNGGSGPAALPIVRAAQVHSRSCLRCRRRGAPPRQPRQRPAKRRAPCLPPQLQAAAVAAARPSVGACLSIADHLSRATLSPACPAALKSWQGCATHLAR